MKFKYNYLENRLWRLEDEYTYEVCENNFFRDQQVNFRLGEKEWIIFTFSHSIPKVYYQKGSITYQKTLDFPNGGEISWEFTEQDQINHEK